MRRCAYVVPFASLFLAGCLSMDAGPEGGGFAPSSFGAGTRQPQVPGVQGPYGQSVPMTAPYSYRPPASSFQAKHMMQQSMPLSMVQMNAPGMAAQQGMTAPGALPPNMVMPASGILSPPGVPFAPGAPNPNGGMMPPFPPGRGPMGGMMPPFPPGRGMMPPGMPGMPNMPGMPPRPGGDSGIVQASFNSPTGQDESVKPAMYGAVAAMGAMPPSDGVRFSVQRTQVRFLRPTGMRISWYTRGPDGQPTYSTVPIEAPGRYNFQQGAVYRLKLSNIERRPGLEVYPTLEVVPVNPKTEAFLAHSAVPIEFTDEDFNQIAQGNLVVKVIYLPDPQYQEYAGAGIDQILSTQLEPGADPIKEALRRGSILLVIRMGNVDQEAPNTPPLGAASTSNNASATAGMAGMLGQCPPPMVPYFTPPCPVPPNFVLPGLPPAPPEDNKAPDPKKAMSAAPPPGAIPDLMSSPPNVLVAPPESVRPMPQAPAGLTGRSTPVDAPPEAGPPPTQLPDAASTPPDASAIPEELLNTMPPETRNVPVRMPGMSGPLSEELPSIESSRPPESLSVGAQNEGRPTMLPATDPGQPPPVQPISGSGPANVVP